MAATGKATRRHPVHCFRLDGSGVFSLDGFLAGIRGMFRAGSDWILIGHSS